MNVVHRSAANRSWRLRRQEAEGFRLSRFLSCTYCTAILRGLTVSAFGNVTVKINEGLLALLPGLPRNDAGDNEDWRIKSNSTSRKGSKPQTRTDEAAKRRLAAPESGKKCAFTGKHSKTPISVCGQACQQRRRTTFLSAFARAPLTRAGDLLWK
jgi:hypothetical protein